jgi:hypothetical protein
MPYKLGVTTELLDQSGATVMPPMRVNAGTLVNRGQVVQLVGRHRRIAQITTLSPPIVNGWVDEKAIIPLYGQTEKAGGLVLEGNQETKDLCQRYAKELDRLQLPMRQPGALQSFMIGVLLCENLDGKKIYYVSLSGNHSLPVGWDTAAKAMRGIPAPPVPNGQEHLRNLGGRVFEPLPAGARVQAAVAKTYGSLGPQPQQSWNDPYHPKSGASLPPIPRSGNQLGSCAAQKMIQLAIKNTDTMRYLWEQWYDANHGPNHGVAMESCQTCKITVTRMLKRG